jgi:protein-S-isoprenylcysteine O-methyltransferase Ste14
MNLANLTLWQIEMLPWYAFIVVWVAGALRLKATKTAEPFAARLFTGAIMGAAFVLLFNRSLPLATLRDRIVPVSSAVRWTGIALTFAGTAIAIWARFILGENWSGKVTLKMGHELVRSGPYAYVRHPIYTGLLLAVIGTALEIGEWRGVPAVVLLAIALSLKARREEQFLTTEFGERYRQYQQRTGSLVPRLR